MKAKIDLGRVDWDGKGRNANRVLVEMEYKEKEKGRWTLSCVAEVRNANGSGCSAAGQVVDELESRFPGLFAEGTGLEALPRLWRRWHGNDFRAGTPAQEEALRRWHAANPGARLGLDEARKVLAAEGLDPDGGYRYGSAWLFEEICREDVAEILSIFCKVGSGKVKGAFVP